MTHWGAVLRASPWILYPLVTALRARHSRSLDDVSLDAGSPASTGGERIDAPLVSLVIPARNEARNIARCLSSALAADYPRLEVVCVDDHSTDDTGVIAAGLAAHDPRLRVVTPPPLPGDWFGKQWACSTGAAASSGTIIGFLDADTWQTPDLVPRVVRAIESRRADLLSVAGAQELGSFWERIIQPQLFSILLSRYGGTESVSRSRFVSQKIANGQCLFMTREAYVATGGHHAVRDKVAEDLALAQHVFASGRRVALVLGVAQLHTRMYTSLRELVEGWGKNIYAGGRHAVPLGALGRALFPLLLVLPALFQLVPPIVLAHALTSGAATQTIAWAAIATAANLLWWLAVYASLDLSLGYALLHPLGAAVLLYIALRAIVRGRRVRWKGRDYQSA